MDALSDVLKSVRLEGAVYLDAEFTAPWCLVGRFRRASVSRRLPGAGHVLFFHFLVEGHCKVRLAEGGETLEVSAGDVVLFPQDDRHLMGSDLNIPPLETENAGSPGTGLAHMRHGGGGEVTRFVCSYLACDRSMFRPLIEALPRVVRIPVGDGPASALLRELLRSGVRESSGERPGAASVCAKLAELMFVEALRRYVERLPPEGKGWLAAVRDAQVGRALALMHGDPGRAWTVDELARGAALSRSALADRFAALVGEPPIQYLARWRLALAAQALRSGKEPVTRISERSGYESEAAFSRAFRREFGQSPTSWRKAGPA